MTRVHFLASDEPLREGSTVQALCGAEVPNIAFVYLFDEKDMNSPEDLSLFRSTCSKCLREPIKGRRVYALVNAQEALIEQLTEA